MQQGLFLFPAGKKTGNWTAGTSWGEDDDGGWSQGPAVTGSGWTDPGPAANNSGQDFGTWHNPSLDAPDSDWNLNPSTNSVIVDSSDKEAWPSIGNSENASDAGDDTGSVKSGSVISSSSSHGQNQETNQGSSAMQSQSASNPWNANSTFGGHESNAWGLNNPPSSSAANMNPMGWGSSNPHPSLSMNNQGHNMQIGTSIAGGDNLSTSLNSNASMSRMGWGMGAPGQGSPRLQNSMQMQTSNGNNMHGMMPSSSGAQQSGPPVSGNQTGPLNNQITWQGSGVGGMFGGLSGHPKTSESGWNNPSSAVMNNIGNGGKDISGNNGQEGGDAGTSVWGSPDPLRSGFSGGWGEQNNGNNPPPSSQIGSQWDSSSKSQWGDNSNGAANSQGTGNNPELLSWAQAACKGLNTGSNSGSGQPSAGGAAAQPSGNPRDDEIRRAIESHDGWGARPVRQDTGWEIADSPKTKRKFSTDSGGGAANVWNNNNGTAIWEASRDSSNSGWNGASGGSHFPDEKDPNTWNNPPGKLGSDPNTWGGNGGGGSDKSIGTWGGDTQSQASHVWGTKTETGSWGEASSNRSGSLSQWGDHNHGSQSSTGWEEPSPNIQRRQVEGRVDDGTGYWGGPQQTQPHVSRQSSCYSTPSTPATPLTPRAKPDEPWNKGGQVSGPGSGPGPKTQGSGWGDPNPGGVKVDDGTSIWAANAQHQARAGGWGDTGSQWNPAVGAKPKSASTSSWNEGGDASWNSRKIPNKFPVGNNHHTQMRSKLLQQLMDMGFKKEEAQHALISNNMNVDSAIGDLMANKKDLDMDVFQSNGAKPKMPGMVPDGSVMMNDDISDTQSESNPHVPNFPMQNTPFQNAQVPNQPFMTSAVTNYDRSRPGPSLPPPSSLNPNNSSINPTLQQKLMQHKLHQQQQTQSIPSMSPTQGPLTRGQMPNAQTVMQQQILQQLRMAVQSGLISPQLLNQQLPHNILVVLQQLLQLQNVLQQLVTKQQFLQQNKVGLNLMQRQQLEQLSAMINSIKQQILQLQKQLSQAQQILLKTTPQNQPPPGPQQVPESLDPLMSLQPDLSSLSINPPQPQSRLNQWKRPTPDKETVDVGGENLNKAVGSKPIHPSQSTPNLGRFADLSGLNISGDTTWSTQATTSSQNWPTTSVVGTTSQAETKESSDNKESHPPTVSTTSTINLTDVIPEFVPGKPWQGLTKSVEDDPHITPGSISRSLSVNVVKDDYLNNLANIKSSPSVTAESSTTWSMKGVHTSLANPLISSKQSWTTSESMTSSMSDVWSVPSTKNSFAGNRPPPGLSGHNKPSQWPPGVHRQQSWSGRTDNSAFTPVNSHGWDSRIPNASTWLVLRNLTPQIDGSTLRTLCQQHGPLRLFYLNLSYGQALVRYNSRDEACKAQKSLNTCVLGNTTILAEFVSDSEAAHFVEQQSAMSANPSQWSQNPPQPNYHTQVGHGVHSGQNHGHGGQSGQNHGHNLGHNLGHTYGHYSNRSEANPWSASMPAPTPMPVSGGVVAGGTMWGSSLWGGMSDDHNSNPLLGNILGGESM